MRLFLRRGSWLVLLWVMVACVTASHTAYNTGVQNKELENNQVITGFNGNAHTSKKRALVYAQFSALEFCQNKGFKYILFLKTEDGSKSETVQKTVNYKYTAPTQIQGSAFNTGFGTNYNAQISGGNSYGSSQTYNDTTTWPNIYVLAKCMNSFHIIGIETRELPANDLKEFVKDRLGGVQIKGFSKDTPNRQKLKLGDIIIKVTDQRIENLNHLQQRIATAPNKKEVNITFVRSGKIMSSKLTTTDLTQDLVKISDNFLTGACNYKELKIRPICSGKIAKK